MLRSWEMIYKINGTIISIDKEENAMEERAKTKVVKVVKEC